MDHIKGKIAVVTGASEGIGRSICIQLAANGARLALVARTQSKLEALADQIRNDGGEASIFQTDVTQPLLVKEVFKKIIGHYQKIDILVNNAGRGLRKKLADTSDAEWLEVINLNLSSVFYCCREVIPIMGRQKGGHIINIGSRSGRVGEAEFAAYCAAKHEVVGLTRALAQEEGRNGIIINVVCPGSVATERMKKILPSVDKSNWLAPDDVASSVLFLIRTGCSYMQGQSLDMFSIY